MEDYILIPDHVNNIADIYSENLHPFFKGSNISDKKISLDNLRRLYVKDKEMFQNIVDELVIRGFQFVTVKKNNLLPNYFYQTDTYLAIEENEDRYKQIDFSKYGLGNFILRFNVKSDLFFNGIQFDALYHLNKHLDMDGLKDEFISLGFFAEDHKEDPMASIVHNSNSDNPVMSEREIILSNIPIDKVFNENRYNSFRAFCTDKSISNILQVTTGELEEYSNRKGVGHRRVTEVKDRIDTILTTDIENLQAYKENNSSNFIFSSNKTIKEVFDHYKDKSFVDYCTLEGILTINDLTDVIVENFGNQPRIRKKKVEEIKTILEDYRYPVDVFEQFVFESGDMYSLIKQRTVVDVLKTFHIDSSKETELKISDIEGLTLKDIGIEDADLIILSRKLKKQRPLNMIAENINDRLSEQQYKVLVYRLIKKLTLEETGKQFDLTRERIRQIERKAINEAWSYLYEQNTFSLLDLITGSPNYITENDLFILFGSGSELIIELLKTNDSPYLYDEIVELFIINKDIEDQIKIIDHYIDELPDYFSIKTIDILTKKLHEVGFEDYAEEIAEKILKGHGYKQYGDYFSRGKLAIIDVLEILFKYHIDLPVRIDNEGTSYIASLAQKILNFSLDSKGRQIDARVRDVNNIILVDRLTFQWFDQENFDSSIIDEIDEFLEKRLQEISVVNAEEIYDRFKNKIEHAKITNKLHLYSIIKFYLSEEYDIGQGNTLNIYSKEGQRINAEETLVQVIRSLGGKCTKDDIQEKIKWPRYKIDLTLSKSNLILSWGINQVKLLENLDLTEEQKKNLLDLAAYSLKDGYSTSSLIFNEIKFDSNLSILIREKELDDPSKLAGLLKALNPAINGHTNFLYLNGSPITSMEEAITHEFNRPTTRQEIRDFITSYGYKDLMPFSILRNLLDSRQFIEISRDELIPAHMLKLTNEEIQAVIDYVEDQMKDKEYLSLMKLKGYRRKLPSIDYLWNPHLIKTVIVGRGFKHIEKDFNDYRYDELIIVRENSTIHSFSELVYKIIDEEYAGQMHEKAIYEFLTAKGIVREQIVEVKKVLPYELKHSELFTFDQLGFVSLRK